MDQSQVNILLFIVGILRKWASCSVKMEVENSYISAYYMPVYFIYAVLFNSSEEGFIICTICMRKLKLLKFKLLVQLNTTFVTYVKISNHYNTNGGLMQRSWPFVAQLHNKPCN